MTNKTPRLFVCAGKLTLRQVLKTPFVPLSYIGTCSSQTPKPSPLRSCSPNSVQTWSAFPRDVELWAASVEDTKPLFAPYTPCETQAMGEIIGLFLVGVHDLKFAMQLGGHSGLHKVDLDAWADMHGCLVG